MVIEKIKSSGEHPFHVPVLKILTTGGTIEKSYDEKEGVFGNKDSFMAQEIKSKIRMPHTEILVETLMNKDSLNMDAADRLLIYKSLKSVALSKIPVIVLHGTDTLVETTAVCVEQMQKEQLTFEVPVIFTGSMRPIGFDASDALQNVTEALMAAKLLSGGVYVSFHNQIFLAPHLIKNKTLRTFEWKA
jgi:L-asparaginase